MGSKKRRTKLGDLLALVAFGLITYALLAEKLGLVFLSSLWIFVVFVWVGFLMPTWCDYEVGGRGCMLKANGKLRGCHYHARLKRDAAFAVLRCRNPGQIFRLMWSTGAPLPGRRVGTGAPDPTVPGSGGRRSAPPSRRSSYDASMWFLTAVSAVAAVVALFLPK